MATDPVCGMEANDNGGLATEFEGTKSYFCSTDWRDFFTAHPWGREDRSR